MVFINHTPIFHIIKRTFAEEICGLYFIFIVAMTLFNVSNGHISFSPVNVCVAALCFGSFAFNVFANIKTYTAIRDNCAKNIQRLLFASTDELDEDHKRVQQNAKKAAMAGDLPALVAMASVNVFNEYCQRRQESFNAHLKYLAKLSTALLVYLVLMTAAILAVRFFT